MTASSGVDGDHAFAPGDGWSSHPSSQFCELISAHGFQIRQEPSSQRVREGMKYSRGGMIVSSGYGSPCLMNAWRLYEELCASDSAPQLTTILVAGELNKPLSVITNSGETDPAFSERVPAWIRSLGVCVRDDLASEWFVTAKKQQMIITRRRLLIGSEGILTHLQYQQQHLPAFPPGLIADLSLGAPLGAVARCILPEHTPAIERFDDETTVLLWRNARVTLVNQLIYHKQLVLRSCI
jgi:hypothetical protein